jgi:hypothetical protein
MQSQMTQDQFAQRSQSLDTSQGTISQCQPTPSDSFQPSDASATFDVRVTRGTGSAPTTGTITLVKENGGWKIDTIDPSLSLT